MNKRIFVAAIVFSTILISLFWIQLVEVTKANPIGQKPIYEICTIQSPKYTTYNTNTILVKFLFKTNFSPTSLSLCYTLDGSEAALYGRVWSSMLKVNQTVISQTTISHDGPYLPYTDYHIEGTAVLSSLNEGKHTITVYRGPNYDGKNNKYIPYGTVQFTVDTTPPAISIWSLPNRCFQTTNASLNFTVFEPVSELTYSLDGNSKVTFTDSAIMVHQYGVENCYFTINNLGEGNHSLKIYAKDFGGLVGESEIYYFTVNTQPQSTLTPTPTQTSIPTPTPNPSPTQEPTSEPTQTATITPSPQEPTLTPSSSAENNQTQDYTLPIALSAIALVVVAIGLTVYLMKNKRR